MSQLWPRLHPDGWHFTCACLRRRRTQASLASLPASKLQLQLQASSSSPLPNQAPKLPASKHYTVHHHAFIVRGLALAAEAWLDDAHHDAPKRPPQRFPCRQHRQGGPAWSRETCRCTHARPGLGAGQLPTHDRYSRVAQRAPPRVSSGSRNHICLFQGTWVSTLTAVKTAVFRRLGRLHLLFRAHSKAGWR